ncbi:MAG: hypothetical protein ACC657_18045 [Thiohalomonadales bacterium]
MRLIAIIIFSVTFGSLTQAEGTQAELEIRQRDVVIEELTEIIFYSFKGHTQAELIDFLNSHPKTIKTSKIVRSEENYVFWGTTVKFKFKNDKLTNVYW